MVMHHYDEDKYDKRLAPFLEAGTAGTALWYHWRGGGALQDLKVAVGGGGGHPEYTRICWLLWFRPQDCLLGPSGDHDRGTWRSSILGNPGCLPVCSHNITVS